MIYCCRLIFSQFLLLLRKRSILFLHKFIPFGWDFNAYTRRSLKVTIFIQLFCSQFSVGLFCNDECVSRSYVVQTFSNNKMYQY